MLKSHLPPRGRTRIYWDGAALQAHAGAMGDPSVQWLDLPALAQAAGAEGAHVWIAPAPAPERSRRAAVGAYERTLLALGVDCRAAAGHGVETECLRCGHGWRDASGASELALALEVLADAAADAFDAAFIFAPGRVFPAIAGPLARVFPAKRLGRISFGSAPPVRSDAPVLMLRPAHVLAARLPPPGRMDRAGAQIRFRFQPAAEEASSCP